MELNNGTTVVMDSSIMDIEWFKTRIEGLSDEHVDEEKLLDVLKELHIACSSLSGISKARIGAELNLEPMINRMVSPNNEISDICISFVKMIISASKPFDIIKKYDALLGSAVNQPSKVKKLVIDLLNRVIQENEQSPERMTKYEALILFGIECLKSPDGKLSEAAVYYLSQLGRARNGADTLLTKPVVNTLKEAMRDDIIKFRVYQLVVDISCDNEYGFQLAAKSGILEELIKDGMKDDLLIQLNAYEMINKLAKNPLAFAFLEDHGSVKYLTKIIAEKDRPLLRSCAIKFFGNITRAEPKKIFNDYFATLSLILEIIEKEDLSGAIDSMEMLAYIAGSVEGKRKLIQSRLAVKTLPFISDFLKPEYPIDLRVRCLNCVAALVNCKFDEEEQPKVSEYEVEDLENFTEYWFEIMVKEPQEMLYSLCANAIPELKLAGLHLLKAVVTMKKGQEIVKLSDGIFEYLLDRNTYGDMKMLCAKYEVVKTIVETRFADTIFGQEKHKMLQDYCARGPVYVPKKEPQVATKEE